MLAVASRGQHCCSNLTQLWADVIGSLKFRVEETQDLQSAAEWPNDRLYQEKYNGPGAWQNFFFKKYLLVDGCNETESSKMPRIECHTDWACKTKPYRKGHICSSWMCLEGLWSLVTWVLVCFYNLCQRVRHSLKTLGMQFKDQQSRVDCFKVEQLWTYRTSAIWCQGSS